MKTLLLLFGPPLLLALAAFVLVDFSADPGGVWPPSFVALFTAVPVFIAALVIDAIVLGTIWLF